ncbi:hypothetical protein OSB04_023130 [Centaurea solstitialis]|uniref:DUF659 domain-containing protein n=1 Tax=Centaurea solstitialis TaxID=347529 RepID=A0AA38SR28_9ASTR|nr:hypothetical protein OSB04_023130 [Centaurea solstitialis]
MAFGKNKPTDVTSQEDTTQQVEDEIVDLEEEENNQNVEQPKIQKKTKQKVEKVEEIKPLYDEVNLIGAGKSKNPGGSKSWSCKHCHEKYTSSYTRTHHHFFGAPPGTKCEIKRCKAMMNNREAFLELQKRVKDAEAKGVSKSLRSSVVTKKNTKPMEQHFAVMERSAVDLKIARAFYANGIPFNVLRNPQFREMVNAIRKAPEGYKAPSSEKARTVLLDECVRDVEKDLTPFKDTWYSQGISIVSDGWSNIKHKPLINVLAVNSRGAMFMYAEDFSGVEKTGAAIAEFLNKAIESVGPSNVLSVVTDNAANCKAAGKEVEKVYKHIFWSPCCVHTLNLIFKDFANEFDWLDETYSKGKTIVKYFLNHGQALSIFRENSNLELLKVAKTRFASHYILLKRLMKCREALSTTISLNSWRDWVKQGDEHTKMIGQLVVETIRDENFWEQVEDILKVTKPLFLMVKFCDGEGPKMGEIYERMDNMLGKIKDVMEDTMYSSSFPEVEQIIVKRWDKMTIPLHCLGFALSPRFYDTHYLETVAPGGTRRKAPNLDVEVVQGVMSAFSRIVESNEEFRLLREQFAIFHQKKGLYSLPAAQMDAVTMEAIDWWATYGAETSELADVAIKVLSQPISSSSAERNWSTYSYIHSVKRNRLNSKRADKLVYIHSNIRLVSRFSEAYKDGPHKKWDMDPESTYLEGSTFESEWEGLDDEDDPKGKGKKQRQGLSESRSRSAIPYRSVPRIRLKIPIFTSGLNIPIPIAINPQPIYINWLHSKPPNTVLYISFGSFLPIPDSEFKEIAAGVLSSGVSFLWVTRGKTANLKEILGHGENGMVVEWCDQMVVLSHSSVGGFWTHCGWNSVKEGLFSSVPMLTFPLILDQPLNEKMIVCDWGVGRKVRANGAERFTRGEIAEVVRGFMDTESVERVGMVERAGWVREICRDGLTVDGDLEGDENTAKLMNLTADKMSIAFVVGSVTQIRKRCEDKDQFEDKAER